MTALKKVSGTKLAVSRRRHDEVMLPRPCHGDHKVLVRAAYKDVVARHDETLAELAKV